MPPLQIQLAELKQKVAQFQEALDIVESQPKYQPPIGVLAPLDYLKAELAATKDDAERSELLEKAKAALEHSQSELNALQAEVDAEMAQLTEAVALLGADVAAAEAARQQWIEMLGRVKISSEVVDSLSLRIYGTDTTISWKPIAELPTVQMAGQRLMIRSASTGLVKVSSSWFV